MNDTYIDNILVNKLETLQSRHDLFERLLHLPRLPKDIEFTSDFHRVQCCEEVADLHIPQPIEFDIFDSINLMIRSGYRHRNPLNVTTWRDLHHPGTYLVPRTAPAATVVGLPGVGKSITCATILSKCYPQVIDHDDFPNSEGPVKQVVWLSVEAPHSGKARDFVDNLMDAWNTATGQARFQRPSYSTSRRSASDLNEWLQVAKTGFLGVLHIDEVQNLFQLSSAASRKSNSHKRELRIVEDDLLKWLLNLSNSGQIPVLYSGTPDGLDALAKRFSNAQRSTNMGYHPIPTFNQQSLSAFKNHFLIYLFAYQYTERQIELTDELATLILKLSAGIPRIVMGLWIAAHRYAIRRGHSTLSAESFELGSQQFTRMLSHGVSALNHNDRNAMSHYEDLMPRDSIFWNEFLRSNGQSLTERKEI